MDRVSRPQSPNCNVRDAPAVPGGERRGKRSNGWVKVPHPASPPAGGALSSGVTTDIGRDDAAGVALRERWRHESLGSVWLRPADWYHPAVDDLAGAVLGDRDPTLAAA